MIIVTWENKRLFVLTEFITYVCNKWTWAVVLMLNGPKFEITAALVKFQHCKIQGKKKKKKSCVKLKNWAEWGSSGAGFMAAQYAVGPGAVETCAQREERVSESPSKTVPHCHLQGCRPSSAVSHLYFSSGAAVSAQTTYFENQSQLRQNLTAQVQDSDANCLLPSDS